MLPSVFIVLCWWVFPEPAVSFALNMEAVLPPALEGHLQAIAKLTKPAPMIDVPEGWF